eukprot:GHVQ01022850.1.p1 GENE.GHVQ01022850.1~~GHVQ01022850.1.p1  ORF type:complete len:101 (-),score=4.57 GHVQ01022850.1:454-756(-)
MAVHCRTVFAVHMQRLQRLHMDCKDFIWTAKTSYGLQRLHMDCKDFIWTAKNCSVGGIRGASTWPYSLNRCASFAPMDPAASILSLDSIRAIAKLILYKA